MTVRAVILVAALICLMSPHPLRALSIEYSQPRKMEGTSFTRLGDFLGFHMANPTRTTVFTNPKVHTGLFFEVELDTPIRNIPDGYSVKLEILTQLEKDAKTFSFNVPHTKHGPKALYLGITDEPYATANSIRVFAWKVTILDKAGKPVTAWKSKLWEY